jgi:hypothetical protein
MRRLLILPALFLVLLGAPVLATESTEVPPATTAQVPLAGGETVSAGWQSAETPVPAAEVVGVTWDGDPSAVFAVEVRSEDGSWQSAQSLGSDDTGTDAGTADAAQAVATQGDSNATEPIWAPDTTAVRVTLQSGEASGVAIAAVDADPAVTPSGAAGAASGILPVLGGPERWAFAVVLLAAAVLLGAFALGFSPWRRSRARRTLLLVALGSLVLVACVPPPPPPPAAPPGNGATQPAITSRGAWGARGFSCAGGPQSAPSLKFAVVHHTAGSNNYNPGDTPSILRGIQAYHMDALGYCDIAYSFLIDKYGQIFEGRAGGITNPIIGGHAGGFNTSSVGVSLVGDYTGSTPPASEWNSLVSLLRWRLSVGGVNPAAGFSTVAASSPCGCVRWAPGTPVSFPNAIVGHRDLDTTSCPGNSFYPQFPTLRDQVQTGVVIAPVPPPPPPPPPTTTTTTTT